MIAALFCFFALLAISILNNVTAALLSTGTIQRPGESFAFKGVAGVMAFAPLYGILVIVVLMLPAARSWARSQASSSALSREQIIGDAAAPATRPTSRLAVASLVCSMIPFALLTQIARLALGITALVKIRKSNGALGGKGFAIAGVIISSLAILFIGGIIAIIGLTSGFK